MNALKTFLYRLLARGPLKLYHWGWSRLFGTRCLRLHHLGRRSGRMREVLLEVVQYDPGAGHIIVASAWGARAQWYRNLLKHPQAQVDFGGRRFWVYATPVQLKHGQEILRDYERRHPWLSALLRFLLGPGVWEGVRLFRLDIEVTTGPRPDESSA